MRWMVRGVLPLAGLAALYGASGSGKSFLTLDLSAAIAGGDDWFGRRVKQRPVTYVCLEGEEGMSKRVRAWSHHHGRSVPEALQFVTQPFDLRKANDVIDLAKTIETVGGTGGLVVLDTLNRAAPGVDENSSVDMGKVIAAAKSLQSLTGGLVLLVHHTGKDARQGMRGHSSLHAALDGAIEVVQNGERRGWRVEKSKDDESGSSHAFRLQVVTVGVDDDGEGVTSCVVVQDESSEYAKQVKLAQGKNQRSVLNALLPLLATGVTGISGVPTTRPCIALQAAVSAGADVLTCASDKRTSRAREAIMGLIERGVLVAYEGWIWQA